MAWSVHDEHKTISQAGEWTLSHGHRRWTDCGRSRVPLAVETGPVHFLGSWRKLNATELLSLASLLRSARRLAKQRRKRPPISNGTVTKTGTRETDKRGTAAEVIEKVGAGDGI